MPSRRAGFSLIEAIMVMGVIGVAGYFLSGLIRSGATGQKTLLAQDDARVLTESMANIMGDPCACELSLGDGTPSGSTCNYGAGSPPTNLPAPKVSILTYSGPTTSSPTVVVPDSAGAATGLGPYVTQIYDRNKATQFVAPAAPSSSASMQTYGNKGVKLYSINIGGNGTGKGGSRWVTTATDASGNPSGGQAVVEVDWIQTGGQGSGNFNGPQHLKRYFIVYATQLDSAGKIIKCHATASGGGGGGGGGGGSGGAPGQVSAFVTACPTGWLEANGSAISRSTYATLFSLMGTIYGAGDGGTTFNLPDLRGQFVRGYDDGRGVDSGRILGTSQSGSRIVVDWRGSGGWDYAVSDWGTYYSDVESVATDGPTGMYINGSGVWGATTITYARVRPTNVALYYCVNTGN
jgi:type II secretory pathway pseudopilin PulG